MNTTARKFLALLTCAAALGAGAAAPASAQSAEAKEKQPLYTYEGFWVIPRPKWGDMAKNSAADQKTLDAALASGTIIAYGNDENLVHQAEGYTHDDWWQSHSMAGLLNVLDTFYKAGSATSPVLESATKHWDGMYVSRFYNWRPGSYKGAYTHVGTYLLKAAAPQNAVEMLSKSVFVPFFEKLLADGSIVEYEVDQEAIHTESPDHFYLAYICSSAEGLDKVNAALRDAIRANSLISPTFESMVDDTPHRDYLLRSNATYK